MFITAILILMLLFLMLAFEIKILQPDGLYIGVWLVFIVGSIALLNDVYSFSFAGVNWIICGLIMFSLGYQITYRHFLNNGPQVIKEAEYIPNISWGLINAFNFLAMLGVIVSAIHYGVSLSSFTNFTSLQNMSHNIAVQRYSGANTSSGTIGQILLSFTYVIPACAGYSWIYAKNGLQKLTCIFTFIPSLLLMIITSAKLAIICYIILFFAGYYTSYLYKNKKCLNLNFTNTIKYIILGGAFFILLILSFVLRIGTSETNLAYIIIQKMAIYGFGHIQGFDIWFTNRIPWRESFGFGANTFLAISSKLGFLEKKSGIYDMLSGACTNVYTPFRALIEDFGSVVALVCLMIFGGIVAYFYYLIIFTAKKRIGSQIGMIISVFCMVYFICSPWVYTTYIFAFCIIAFFIWFSFRKDRVGFKMLTKTMLKGLETIGLNEKDN
jgi:oligosaccharide repeat unit polymerase